MTAVDWEKPRAFCAEIGASSSRWNEEGVSALTKVRINDYMQTLALGYGSFQPSQRNINGAVADVGTEAA